MEPKLPLIWWDFIKVLVPVIKIAQRENSEKLLTEVMTILNRLIKLLNKLSEEKSSWGSSFLGAIGVKNNDDTITNR